MPEVLRPTLSIDSVLKLGPVIPVIVLHDISQAVPLARALVAGGIRVLEMTLRTPVALDALRCIAEQVPDAVLGAGTLTHPEQCYAARQAGAQFGVSPGINARLSQAAHQSGLPLLPGVATPSEILLALEHGHQQLKFFPAENHGGTAALRAWHGPFPDVRFCPTGGITANNARDYLALPNVVCVGGSWLTPPTLLAAGDWNGITELAQRACTEFSHFH